MRRAITKHLAVLAFAVAPLAAGPALAQSEPRTGLNSFAPIQCAGASALCGWKRIPGAGGWQGFESRPRVRRRPHITPR